MIQKTAGYKRFGDMTLVELYRSNIRPEQHPTVKVTCRECGGSAIESYMPGLLLTPFREMICSDCKKATIFDFECHDKKEDEMIEMLTDEFIEDSNKRISEARTNLIFKLMGMEFKVGKQYEAGDEVIYSATSEEDRKKWNKAYTKPSDEPLLPTYAEDK